MAISVRPFSARLGLQFVDLRERILSDDLYQGALAVAEGRAIMSEVHRMNIYLLIRFDICDLPFGHIVEYGSHSSRCMKTTMQLTISIEAA